MKGLYALCGAVLFLVGAFALDTKLGWAALCMVGVMTAAAEIAPR